MTSDQVNSVFEAANLTDGVRADQKAGFEPIQTTFGAPFGRSAQITCRPATCMLKSEFLNREHP
jgi:hypothetical protein